MDCPNPVAVVLCENKSFLKQPRIAKKHQIKLWYVGGNNIRIIDDIDEAELAKPFFYSCDWDLAGLQIYSRIKTKLKLRDKLIAILYLNEPNKQKPVNSPYHKSKWRPEKTLSGLNSDDFEKHEILLIEQLINTGQWIEEESNNLETMLKAQFSKIDITLRANPADSRS